MRASNRFTQTRVNPMTFDAMVIGSACGYKKPTTKAPSLKTMERWMCDGVAKATDGCRVEPDGVCCHGHTSWLLQLGLI